MPPEVCSWMCRSILGQIVVIATILLTLWQEIRHQRSKDTVKVIEVK